MAALVEVLGEDMALRSSAQPPELDAGALALLSAQLWRGNIRELRNVLEQAMMRSDSHHISVGQLQAALRESGIAQLDALPVVSDVKSGAPLPSADMLLRPLAQQVAELERQAIAAAMTSSGGNKMLAAKTLGISRATLYERLDKNV